MTCTPGTPPKRASSKFTGGLRTLASALLLSTVVTFPVMMLPAAAYAQDDDSPLNVNLANDSVERKPGQKPDPASLEGGIWAETAKVEFKAKTSGERNSDPALNTYVSGVLTKITGPYAGDVRLYMMDRPFFNASMAPNGYTEVWTGLLLRCESEDELAFVLGHESGHFRHSHSVKTYQAAKDSQNAALAATLLLSVVAAGASMNATSYQAINSIRGVTSGLIDIVYLGTIAAYFGYSRDTEAMADSYGMTYARQAGYYPLAGVDLWQERLSETAASDYDKVRRSPSRINVFGDHPLEADRISALIKQDKALNKGTATTQDDATAKAARLAYRAHIRPYIGVWLKDDLRRQDYGQTLYIIGRMSRDGEDQGVLNFYAGEAYRLRGHNGPGADAATTKATTPAVSDFDNAITAYKKALSSPDAPRETWRQLGDVYRHTGNTAAAIDAFNAYLKAMPDATDAWMVQDQVDTLSKAVTPAAAPVTTPATTTTTTTTTSAEPAKPAAAPSPTPGGTTS